MSVTAAKAPLLHSDAVTVDYGNFRALDDITLSIQAGEVIGIIGPNGAGKTSFVRALCGRVNIDSGAFYVDGSALKHGRARQHLIGLVPQDIALYPHMTARENLSVFANFMGMRGGKNRRMAVTAALDTVELSHKADTRVSALSGGMKRRINVAAAVMHDPKIIILDEPTAGADVPARDTVHRLARKLAQSGKAVLLITHELEQAEAICDRLLILSEGRVLAFDTPGKIMNTHFSSAREVVVRFNTAPDTATLSALQPFGFAAGDVPTEWSAMTNASEVSFVSAFMTALRGGNDNVKEISVRRPGLTHLLQIIEATGELPIKSSAPHD